MYKIQKLVEQDYDFSAIYPEKQNEVKEASGLDFSVFEIVKYLQKQTNNFTIENTIAKDLDDAIYKLVEKYESEQKKPEEIKEVIEEEEVSDVLNEKQLRDLKDTLDGMELIYDDLSDEDKEVYQILKEQYEESINVAS